MRDCGWNTRRNVLPLAWLLAFQWVRLEQIFFSSHHILIRGWHHWYGRGNSPGLWGAHCSFCNNRWIYYLSEPMLDISLRSRFLFTFAIWRFVVSRLPCASYFASSSSGAHISFLCVTCERLASYAEIIWFSCVTNLTSYTHLIGCSFWKVWIDFWVIFWRGNIRSLRWQIVVLSLGALSIITFSFLELVGLRLQFVDQRVRSFTSQLLLILFWNINFWIDFCINGGWGIRAGNDCAHGIYWCICIFSANWG